MYCTPTLQSGSHRRGTKEPHAAREPRVAEPRAVSSQFDVLGEIPISYSEIPPPPQKKFLNNIIIIFYYFQTPVSCHIQLVFHSDDDTNLWRLSSTNLNALYVN